MIAGLLTVILLVPWSAALLWLSDPPADRPARQRVRGWL